MHFKYDLKRFSAPPGFIINIFAKSQGSTPARAAGMVITGFQPVDTNAPIISATAPTANPPRGPNHKLARNTGILPKPILIVLPIFILPILDNTILTATSIAPKINNTRYLCSFSLLFFDIKIAPFTIKQKESISSVYHTISNSNLQRMVILHRKDMSSPLPRSLLSSSPSGSTPIPRYLTRNTCSA